MNIKILKRHIALSKLGIVESDNSDAQLSYDFLMENLSEFTYHNIDRYPEYIFIKNHHKDIILEYNAMHSCMYMNHDPIWTFFRDKMNMEYEDIRELLIWWIQHIADIKIQYITSPSHVFSIK